MSRRACVGGGGGRRRRECRNKPESRRVGMEAGAGRAYVEVEVTVDGGALISWIPFLERERVEGGMEGGPAQCLGGSRWRRAS